MSTFSSMSPIGSDLPSISNIMNFDTRLDFDTLNLKKSQLLIKLKNGEITKSQFNQFISELESKPVFGTTSIIPDNVENLFNAPRLLTQPTIRSVVTLKPVLVEKNEIKKVKSLVKLVGINKQNLELDIYDKSFSPRILNWVEPYEISGIDKTLFYSEVNHGLKVGDRVFIINGNYDNDLLISTDKYKKGRDGYKVLYVDFCKIVLDINFTGVLPYNDDEIDNFIKVHYVRDEQEFLQVNRQITTRGGQFDYKFNKNQNNIIFVDNIYPATTTGWGDNSGVSSGGFYVRDGSIIPATWIDITTDFINGSFSFALSATYSNNERFKVINGTFEYNNKKYQEGFIYKWNVGPTQSMWEVDITYHKPFITKTNFRDGIFNGRWNTGLFGRQNKTIIWDGNGSRWQTGTLLNTHWKKGSFLSKYTSLESYYSDFDDNGIPFQKSNLTNNNGRGFNYIIDSQIETSSIYNGTIINTIFGTQSATFSSVENHLITATTSYNNKIFKSYFESSYLNDMILDNSEITNSILLNSKITRSKLVNSKLTESIIKDSTFISDNIIKIEDYDEWTASEYKPSISASNKIYKFYISRKNYERLKNKDYFYIKGLNIKNGSKEVLNFFDRKFTLSSWSEHFDELSLSYEFYKRNVEHIAYLSSPLDNEYKITSVGSGVSYSTAIVDLNEKSQYSIDIMMSTTGFISSQINYNRDLATSSVSSPTMSNYLGDIIDITNAYIIDSDLESGIIETSNWINGNNISFNNDLNITIPTSLSPTTTLIGGKYNMSIASTSSSILNVTTTYDVNSPESIEALSEGNVVFLNSVYYEVKNYVTGVEIVDGGSSYVSSSGVTTLGNTGSGLIVDIDAPLGTVSNVYIYDPGIGYQTGETVSVLYGDLNAVLQITSVTSSLTLLPTDYKIIANDGFGNLQIQEIYSTMSVFNTLKPNGQFYTPDAQNRYGYLYKTKFYKTKVKSGIFRRNLFVNSLIENDEYNTDDKDFTNLERIRNLVITDSIFKNNKNILSNATYLYSHFVSGDNYWTNGIINKSILNGMTFSNGVVKESRWVDGLFNSGIFYESRTFDGESTPIVRDYKYENTKSYYKDGLTTITVSNNRYSWQNGTFRLGTRNKNSEFYKSDWENGTFENGKFYLSKWYNGLINNGIFGDKDLDVSDTMIYNATVSNVLVENASFYASDTSRDESTSNNIFWQYGIFNDGIFGSNFQQTTASNTATWYDGEFNGGQFTSLAKWKKGNFNGGKFISGFGWTQSNSGSQSLYSWEDGVFNGGEFGNAEGTTNSTWYTGLFTNGLFKGRVWNNGIFEKGQFQGGATTSSVGGLYSSNANSFVNSFQSTYYGLWRDGFFTDQKDKFIKDKKLWTKEDRVEASEQRRSFIPSRITNALWLNGTFSHKSGETNNIVWMNGTFDNGKFFQSSFNPYVKRSEVDQYNVWQYTDSVDYAYNGSFTTSISGWNNSTGLSGSAKATFSVIGDVARYVSTGNSKPLSLTSSVTSLSEGIYKITLDVVTYSSNKISLSVNTGNTNKVLINPVTGSNIGTNVFEVELGSGTFSLKVDSNGQTSRIDIDNLVIQKSPTASFNIDDSCLWVDGNFENGDFYISKWQKGNFIIGTAYGMIWKTGVSNYMNAFNIFWEDGLWRNGNWYGSAFELNGEITNDFEKQILFRGMSWSGTSSCHIWNIFEDSGVANFEISSTASDPVFDESVEPGVFSPPPPTTTTTTAAPEL